jgi:small-conductance mechanosensitive channel
MAPAKVSRSREKERVMRKGLLSAAGIVVIIIGAVFALQGFGVIGGSAMSNNHTFEVVGPLVALAGLALAAFGLRHRGPAQQ